MKTVMETVWEAEIFSPIVILFLVISLIVVFCCVWFLLKSKLTASPTRTKIISGVIIFVLVLINVQNIGDRYYEMQYAERNQTVVEGTVENFEYYTNGADSFSIGEVYFSYPTIQSSIGYDIPKRENNSVISHEGQYVRITYYTKDGVNIITRIETMAEQQTSLVAP